MGAVEASSCPRCRTLLQPGASFCASCGTALGRRSYAGPRNLAIGGGALTVAGGIVAVAAFSTVQAQGVGSLAADLLGPTANQLLDLLGAGIVDVPTDGSNGASLAVVLAFMAGALVGGIGVVLLLAALVWALVRSAPQRRQEELRERARGTAEASRPHVERAAEVARTEVAPRLVKGAAASGRAGLKAARAGREAYAKRNRPG